MQKDEINRKAFEKFKKEHSAVPTTIDNAMPSERFDGRWKHNQTCDIWTSYTQGWR